MAFEEEFEDNDFEDETEESEDGGYASFDDDGEIDYGSDDDDYVSFDDLEDEEDEDFYEMDDE
jgi:hypothetical protein